MKLVVDANVVISALIADSKTRELIVTLEPDLLTPEFVHDEIESHTELIVEKSGMSPERVAQFVELLFQHIEVVSAEEFYPYLEAAKTAMGETDPDDVLYVACALASDADIWRDDTDFDEQDVVETHNERGHRFVRYALADRASRSEATASADSCRSAIASTRRGRSGENPATLLPFGRGYCDHTSTAPMMDPTSGTATRR